METLKNWIAGLGNYALDTIVPAALLLVVGILVVRIILSIVDKLLKKSKLEKAAHTLIRSVVRIALYFLLVMILASRLGIDMTSVIALASVLTLAVSLAVQNALSNMVGGFTLLVTKPFSSGDVVEIAGQVGTVSEIGLNYTKLATPDNKYTYIPNAAVTAGQIINYTVLGTRRIDIAVSASYSMAVEDVLAALRQAGKVATTLDNPAPFAAVQSYGESAIGYVLQVWTAADDYWTTLFDVNNNIKATFEEKGIAFTYPHLNVHLDK